MYRCLCVVMAYHQIYRLAFNTIASLRLSAAILLIAKRRWCNSSSINFSRMAEYLL